MMQEKYLYMNLATLPDITEEILQEDNDEKEKLHEDPFEEKSKSDKVQIVNDKTEIKEVPHGLEFVDKLKPVSFRFKKSRENPKPHGMTKYGFLAQDILELEGSNNVIIDNENDESLKVTNSHLIPVLVKAIQDLKKEIDLLKEDNKKK